MRERAGFTRWLAILPFVAGIRLYQVTLSGLLGRQCRFHPTCSWYALGAYRTHGAIRGTWLTLRRLSRCHPFSGKAGFDPVPLAGKGQREGREGLEEI